MRVHLYMSIFCVCVCVDISPGSKLSKPKGQEKREGYPAHLCLWGDPPRQGPDEASELGSPPHPGAALRRGEPELGGCGAGGAGRGGGRGEAGGGRGSGRGEAERWVGRAAAAPGMLGRGGSERGGSRWSPAGRSGGGGAGSMREPLGKSLRLSPLLTPAVHLARFPGATRASPPASRARPQLLQPGRCSGASLPQL